MIEIQNFIVLIIFVAIGAAVPALAFAAWQFVNAKITEVKAGLSLEQLQLLDNLINMAVQAAQQAGLAGLISNLGSEKKIEAIRIVQDALRSRGLDVLADNVGEIAARIEAAILLEIHKPVSPADEGDVIINQPNLQASASVGQPAGRTINIGSQPK